MAVAADSVFALDKGELNILLAWIGAVAYALQIYFDFSGYSDMAIGLGKMFGFNFRENFDYPYISVNVKEFWRRWHISLSSWFKDYVYIPLGGNRKGSLRTGLNKLIVFFLTGLWHGANWTFVVWGLFHGFFSFLEEFVPAIRKLPRLIGHIYLMLVVIIGFVIFRADNMGQAFQVIGQMFTGFNFDAASLSLTMQQLTPFFIVILVAAVIACGGGQKIYSSLVDRFTRGGELIKKQNLVEIITYVISFGILIWCILRLSSGSYNPFIYFRF